MYYILLQYEYVVWVDIECRLSCHLAIQKSNIRVMRWTQHVWSQLLHVSLTVFYNVQSVLRCTLVWQCPFNAEDFWFQFIWINSLLQIDTLLFLPLGAKPSINHLRRWENPVKGKHWERNRKDLFFSMSSQSPLKATLSTCWAEKS